MSPKKARPLIQSSLVSWGRDLPLDAMNKSISITDSKNLFNTMPDLVTLPLYSKEDYHIVYPIPQAKH